MVQNLKRRRREEPTSRKSPRLDEDQVMRNRSEDESGDEDDAMNQTDENMEGSEGEGDEWGGIEGVESGTPAIVYGGHRTRNELHKPPTGEELRAIKDASDLFKSSSFKLQIDALLPNVLPKSSRIPPLDRFLFALHATLSAIPSIPPQHPLDAGRKLLKKNVAVPYPLPLPTEDTNWKVAFEPPSEITLVGSWANKLSVKSKDELKIGVDLAVEMPNSLFQEKDYLNGRFFHKRAFYLSNIAAAVLNPKSKLNMDVFYESMHDDPRLTKLVLTPRKNGSETDFTKLNAKVCILPVLSSSSPIPINRLSPSHSNLRLHSSSEDESGSVSLTPTPIYNNALLRTAAARHHLLAAHALKNECGAFPEALVLLRVWANQRGFGEGTRMVARGFEVMGTFWWSLLALLLDGEEHIPDANKTRKRKSVGRGISSYQLFKAALEFLAKHDFSKPVFVKAKGGHRFSPEEYSTASEAVFVDSASLMNLLSGVPLGSLDLLKYDAAKTLESLNQSTLSGDPFVGVFLRDHRDLLCRFDIVLRVNLADAKPRQENLHASLDAGTASNAVFSSIDALLKRGLGDSSKAVTILHPSSLSRPVSQAHPSSRDVVFIGIIHNAQNAFRLVDHGPAADEQDEEVVKRFRDLWGDKAELRRFKDGRIVESVVWDVNTVDEKAHIPAMIVKHLLKRHFNVSPDAVETWQAPFDSVLRLPSVISQDIISSKVQAGSKSAITAFDHLVKTIKNMGDEIPLSLLNVSPISGLLRYTSVFTPVPTPERLLSILPPNSRYLAPIEIVLEFEKSSKWPDDLKAIQSIKLAFFERIASALMTSTNGLTARAVVGDGVHDSLIIDKTYLEVITPEGWAFHARIWHDRELTLIERTMGGQKALMPHIMMNTKEKKTKEYYEALEAKEIYLRRYIHAPRHHRAIAALCHHYTAYAGTVRLVKRWLGSHWLLSGHISEEAIEILCASIFLEGGNKIGDTTEVEETALHLVPTSKERGFAMVVQFLKEWKWDQGLFVPLYATSLSDAPGNSSAFSGGQGVWNISTEHDPEGFVWTKNGPDAVVARRVQALAEATWNFLGGLEGGQLNVPALFTHPTDDYDFIIQLDATVLTRYLHNINADPKWLGKRGKYANRSKEDDNVEAMPGFDPAKMFFDDLQRIYADTFKIFYDQLGGDKFGCVWDPSLKQPRPFRVLGGFSSIPIAKGGEKSKGDKGQVILNLNAIVAEIERMGTGLVQKIVMRS